MKSTSTPQPIRTAAVILLGLMLIACTSNPAVTPAPVASSVPTVAPTAAGRTLRVGILINRSAEITVTEWGPLMAYLTTTLGQTFEIVPLSFEEILPAVKNKTVDFVITNSLQAVQARRLYNVEFVVTLASAKTGTEFGGLIIVRSDSGLQTLADLRGKTVSVVSLTSSLGGYAMQAYHLQQAGFDPAKNFSQVTETNSQDNVVLAVLNGTADVGFIRTGNLEKMLAAGTLMNLNEITILEPMPDDFPYTHTTRLYPEWAFFATAGIDPALFKQVQTTLLNIPPGDPSTASAKVDRFVPVVDYATVEEVIKTLQLLSWDATP